MNNKFKSLKDKVKSIYGEVYSRYKITMIMVNIATVFTVIFAIAADSRFIKSTDTSFRIITWHTFFSIFVAVGCFAVEAFSRKCFCRKQEETVSDTSDSDANADEASLNKTTGGNSGSIAGKVVGLILTVILSFILVSLNEGYIFGITEIGKNLVNETALVSWNFAYFILITLLVFYSRYKESGVSIEKYVVHLFTQFIQIGIAWGILAVGFLALSWAFIELIADLNGMFSVPQILIIGLYVVPCVMMAVTNVIKEIGRFFEILIKYVLLIITIAGAAIIYLYIIKTLITGIPSNEIFAISSGLFFVAIPVGFACTSFEKDTPLQKIAYALPYIYAPFIILQCYSIFTRIAEYGITPSRYFGVVLIVLEVIYTLVYAFCRKHIDFIILIMILITLIATVVPGANAVSASKLSQKHIISDFIENGIPSSVEGGKKLVGAVDYLKDEYGKDYIDSLLSLDQQKEISAIDTNPHNTIRLYNLYSDSSFIPTDGYKYVAEFYRSLNSFDEFKDPSRITLTINNRDFGPFDLSEEYESVKKRCQETGDSRVTGPDIIKVDKDYELVITDVNITEDSVGDRLVEFRVSGYLLTNESW